MPVPGKAAAAPIHNVQVTGPSGIHAAKLTIP